MTPSRTRLSTFAPHHQLAVGCAILCAAASLSSVLAAEVTRGPYLNSGTPSSVVVRWRTDEPTASVVNFGTTQGQLTGTVTLPGPTTEHVVTVSNLAPNTRYYYAIGDGTAMLSGGNADTFFETAPAVGTTKPTRIWVLGDSGTGGYSTAPRRVADAYKNSPLFQHPDVWLMLGDNAYGSGEDYEYQDAVFDTYPDFLRNSVLWSTMGNHETYNGLDPLPYYEIFTFPTNAEAGGVPSGTEHYYSFDYGNIHFVCLDSQTDALRAAGGAQAQWLQADLAATTQRWIIAFYHHPPYTKGTHNSDSESDHIEMRQNIQPILEASGVDFVLGGHSHSYERSMLLSGHFGHSSTLTAAMKIDSGDGRESGTGAYGKDPGANPGTVYTVAGHSGHVGGYYGLNHPANVVSMAVLGSVFIDVDGDRLDAKMIDSTGVIRDSFTISKAPVVTVKASGETVPENTGASMNVTVTRTRGLDQVWTVPLELSGTATAEDDFLPPPATVTLGVGAASASVSITPVADALSEGTESVIVAAGPGPKWRVRLPQSSSAFSIIDTPMQEWLASQFGANANNPAIAGLTADPDGDGIPNALERALGLLPLTPSNAPQATNSTGFLTLEYFEPTGNSDLAITVKGSNDLINWSEADITEIERVPVAGGFRVKVQDFVPFGSTAHRYLRLEVRY